MGGRGETDAGASRGGAADETLAVFTMARVGADQAGVNKFDRASPIAVYMGAVTAQDGAPDEPDPLPPVIEAKVAPVVEGTFVRIYGDTNTQPPGCHTLFVLVKGAGERILNLEFRFLDRDEQDVLPEKPEPAVFRVRVKPEVVKQAANYRGSVAFLLTYGDTSGLDFGEGGVRPPGRQNLIDISDDSEAGHASSVTLWLDSQPKDRVTLDIVEALPDLTFVDDAAGRDTQPPATKNPAAPGRTVAAVASPDPAVEGAFEETNVDRKIDG